MALKLTPEEATAMYNVAKIKFDPTSYSLKGNLILDLKPKQLFKEHISAFNDTALETMIDSIYARTHKTAKTLTNVYDAHLSKFSNESVLCVQQDNLYVCEELLKIMLPLAYHSPKVLQTIVMMCVALNSQKSCSKCMAWFTIPEFQHIPYEQLYELEYLKTDLETPSHNLRIFKKLSTSVSNLPCGVGLSAVDDALVVSTFGAYFYAFEVIWAMRALPVEFKDIFEQCLIQCEKLDTYTAFYNPYINITATGVVINDELEKAIAIKSPKDRFKAYQEIYAKEHAAVNHSVNEYLKTIYPKRGLNTLLTAFASFVGQLSINHIRINTIRIVYEFCKANKWLPKIDRSELAAFGSHAGAIKDSETEQDLFRLDDDTSASICEDYEDDEDEDEDKDVESAHLDDTPLFEALDSLKASFSAGKYTFNVEDVVDTSPKSAAKYKAVAEKVTLINKLLIRKIKDIKTYNTGGKHSGQPSGKLDRKALYRYKYDPNIFYNNTYKTLESDLAFGIVLDESGSMSGKGIENGRISMVVLHETFKALNINHSIIGHTSDGKYHSEITRYQSFKEDKTHTVCKNYALISTCAKEGNCDSGALYYMEKALSRVQNKDKICLIFSDGAPTECTGTDLKNQVASMEKAGIKVIGIGINFPSIAKYYKSYANGRNLTDMLNIISKILEEYVLKKKDK